MSQEPLVSVRCLTKVFGEGDTATKVLRGIDLDLARGELIALRGPSGSGKSTLLTILGTLLRPTDGRHEMLGQDLTTASDGERTWFRSQHIGFVFQFHHLVADLSAIENVMMPAAASAGRETAAMRERAGELLDAVGLSDRCDFRPKALSGGQRQRVAVARALINEPSLVLADEPTGNLDRGSANQVMELIDEINRGTGTCFLISTHDDHVARHCRRHVDLLDGRLSTPDEAA